MDPQNLENPELYLNYELSLLAFNSRVLEQARDARVPLLERMRYMCITSSNLDEYFEIRVARLMQQAAYGSVETGSDNLMPSEALARIQKAAHELVDKQYALLNEELLPQMADQGIRFLARAQWTDPQNDWVQNYFRTQLLPIVSPIRLDPAHPFPRVLNKSLHFIVVLEGEDAFGQEGGMAVVQAPRPLRRLIRLPADISSGPYEFVFLSSVIHAQVQELFPGMRVAGCHQFRVTRNSDLFIDPEESQDLLRALEGELPSRRYGDAVRLEVDNTCPADLANFLRERFGLSEQETYQVNGPVNLNRLLPLPDEVDRPDLKFPSFTPSLPPRLGQHADLFEAISANDILLHHPFQSFAPVIDLVRRAAKDPKVLAIKQTLYRTGPESALVDHLVVAARAGKEVTVVVELRARFDEAANISLAEKLQEAGAHVVYGVVGYKTHAKMMLIVRRENEGGGLKRYVHLSTGNYHSRAARTYTDFGLLSCNPEIGEDVHQIFMQLTSLGSSSRLHQLLEAPFTLHAALIAYIDNEAEQAKAGQPSRIIAKMNALAEVGVVRALYRASQAGVSIDLIVRGACILRPGIKGLSDNIRVRSIVGRFLEHTRVFYFENGGEAMVFCASADWMHRNLHQRVETCFPILDPILSERVVEEGLFPYLNDNLQAWSLDASGAYERCLPVADEPPYSAQLTVLERLTEPGANRPDRDRRDSAPKPALVALSKER